MTTATVRPVEHLGFEEAQRRYWARRPWRYDARFHVPPAHITWVPVFLAPPTVHVPQADDDTQGDT